MTHDPTASAAADPRAARNALFGRVLAVPVWLVAAIASVSLLATGSLERVAAWGTVYVLVAVPLVRVAWLVRRWAGRRDRRFAVAGLALLSVAAIGATIALA